MFAFLETIALKEASRGRLNKLRERLNPASLQGLDHCVRCGYCCHQRTCIPTYKEFLEMARFLKLSPQKCFKKFFAIDSRNGDYYIKPVGAEIKDLVGRYIPWERTYNEGKCVFLNGNATCKIYDVRPEMAKQTKCWSKDDTYDSSWDKILKATIKTWSKELIESGFSIVISEDEEEEEE